MKKIILTVLMIVLTTLSYSQARLNSTYKEIKTEFDKPGNGYKEGVIEGKEIPYIQVQLESSSVMYIFDKDDLCGLTWIRPVNTKLVNKYVEKYNNNYVSVSDTEWKAYLDGHVSKIELITLDDATIYFQWSIPE